MSYNTKNYTEQGGAVTHIGGKLVIDEGGSVEGLPIAENQADSTATTVANLKDDFNDLLDKLKAAGLMEADEETE
ncbi:MAG: Head fiber protein [Bacteroidia bacterium]|nr:Head fiber protein [Bacteroidia bacterium]